MRAIISRSASGSRQRTGLASEAAFRGWGIGTGDWATTPPNLTTWEPTSKPDFSSNTLHTAPHATRATVSLAPARPQISPPSCGAYLSLPEDVVGIGGGPPLLGG